VADHRHKRLFDLSSSLRVEPGARVDVATDFDAGYTDGSVMRAEADELLAESVAALTDYQARLAAQDTYGVLLVLQAIDAGGKDGTIRHVMSGVNPQGVVVHSFKVPSSEELSHDFLWRYAQRLPARGQIGIFNRSHYEEVLVVRVHRELLARQRLPDGAHGDAIWERRYREINDWERYLTDNGLRIVKVFLNLSREEQRKRFLARIDSPEKNWKFSAADIAERAHWDDYQVAFSEMLSNTSTKWAPWHVIPADHKWFARIAVGAALVHALAQIDPQYPAVDPAARRDLLTAKAQLEAEAPDGAPPDPAARHEHHRHD
jgi:PPK2 family polyphosphate:nucleotide phosphotransferase